MYYYYFLKHHPVNLCVSWAIDKDNKDWYGDFVFTLKNTLCKDVQD